MRPVGYDCVCTLVIAEYEQKLLSGSKSHAEGGAAICQQCMGLS